MILSLRNPGRGPHFHPPRSRGRENRKGGELHRGSALVKVLQRTKTRGHVHVHRGGGGGRVGVGVGGRQRERRQGFILKIWPTRWQGLEKSKICRAGWRPGKS